MLCRYFWLSDKNKINQNKSSSTSLPTIIHHQPTSSSWSSLWSWSLRTLLFTDVDECSDKIHVCDVNAKCTNTNGSHNCTCTDGYIGDGKSCQGALRTILITIARQSYPSFITWICDRLWQILLKIMFQSLWKPFKSHLYHYANKNISVKPLSLLCISSIWWMQQWKPCVWCECKLY